MKKKSISQFLLIFCLMSISLATGSLLKKNVDFSPFENRVLDHVKRPSPKEFLSGEWFNSFETAQLDQVIGRNIFIETNSRLLRLLGKRQINGITVGTDNTLLQIKADFPPPPDKKNFITEDLLRCKRAADSYGGQVYYMNIYPRNLFFKEVFPYSYEKEIPDNYLEKNQETLHMLENYGIRTVDTYPAFIANSNEYLYFHTDHHYTFKGAYHAYQALLQSIEASSPEKKPLPIPPWDEMQYYRPNKQFWGSLISQIGDTQYDGQDYLEYALPVDFPTEYERFESGIPSDLSLIREDPSEEYGWFMNGDYGNTVICTHRKNLPSILIIGYSFTDALELMAVYSFNEMHSIDPRLFEGDIMEYIKQVKCDYVVIQGANPLTISD